MEASSVPSPTAGALYDPPLHYGHGQAKGSGFRCASVLRKDTNLPLECGHSGGEDVHLTARNKWLLGHPEGGLPEGSPMGLIGENLSVD